jgi:Transposase DDE domain
LVLFVMTSYRLLSPGSEWRLHREWYGRSAAADLLGKDFSLAESPKLYLCHDLLLAHKQAVFDHLTERWRDLFNVSFDVLLYDLTSTYFEADPPFGQGDRRRHGYSRDHRPDCVQVVIALIVTPEGLPLAYEVLAGNTNETTTLRDFLSRIERQYGKARRTWLMDRGIPTEEVLAQMRASDPPVQYLVGTPKGRLTKLEEALLSRPWQKARENVAVKLLPQDGELYVFAESRDRLAKERAMRRRQLKWLWKRLSQIAAMTLSREELLMKLGSARSRAPTAWRLVDVKVDPKIASFAYKLNRQRLRQARRREGRYLLRSNLADSDPAKLWELYLTLVKIEDAFRNLKGDLGLRPIFTSARSHRGAHLHRLPRLLPDVTLGRRLHALAPGLTPRSVFEKFAAMQMIDVSIPTTDGRTLTLTRYTEPEPELKLLLGKLKLDLPPQPLPRIAAAQAPPPNPL